MPPVATPLPTAERWAGVLDDLGDGLLEREAAVRLVLLAALAGEHALLIGPPGTAKSELARRLYRQFEGARYFERLLTRFSTPEELFGPLSLKALEDDRYERLTEGFLPTASIAFLDEVFKANSAILNALLTLLNERMFDNGCLRAPVPLISVVGASNEVPVDEALHAFFDRFLVRVPVQPVGDEHFAALLALPHREARDPHAAVSDAERQAVQDAALQVGLSGGLLEACASLRARLREDGIAVSDRRWRQWMDLLRTAAASEGRAQADEIDLWTAPYVASPSPEAAPALAQWFENEVLRVQPRPAPWLTRAVEAFEKQLEVEQSAREEQGGDDAAGKLALARAVGMADVSVGMDRIVSQVLEEQMRRRYSPVHVEARLAQLDELLARIDGHLAELQAQRSGLAGRLDGRVWIPPAQTQHWLGRLDAIGAQLEALRLRLTQARAGFAALPMAAAAAEEAAVPDPVQWATEDA